MSIKSVQTITKFLPQSGEQQYACTAPVVSDSTVTDVPGTLSTRQIKSKLPQGVYSFNYTKKT